jgi:hypothetical protein
MPKAIGEYGMYGRFPLGLSHVKEAIHDGDTINIITMENSHFPARSCGVDTPEVSYKLPKIGESNPEKWEWKEIEEFKGYLSNPFGSEYTNSEGFREAIGQELIDNYLRILRICQRSKVYFPSTPFYMLPRMELMNGSMSSKINLQIFICTTRTSS